MRVPLIVACLSAMLAAGTCLAGESDIAPPPATAPKEQSNWERFKEGAKQAGGAVASGAKNAAGKTADAVVHGAKKTGEFFSDGYQDVKEYVHEKTE